MKKTFNSILVIGAFFVFSTSCNKKECHECHYDLNGTEVELGEKCDEDLETLEKDGIDVNGVNYEVHCHEH
jgi:hypothetical protein